MKTIHMLSLVTFSAAAIAVASVAGLGTSAHADALQKQGTGQLILPAGNTYEGSRSATSGSFTLVLQEQTTNAGAIRELESLRELDLVARPDSSTAGGNEHEMEYDIHVGK